MKKINILRKAGFLLFFLFFSHLTMAQAIGDFRSIGNGNWTATATWQTWNGSTWVTPTPSNYPGNPGGSYTVTVSTGTTVTVNPTLTVTIGDLYVLGNLQVQKDFNINTNTPIPNLYINNGTILMSSHMGLYLPSGSNIGMNISDPKTQGFQETGGCNGDTGVYIGKKKFSMCQGNSGIGDFQTLNELASSGIAVANATPSEVCLGSSVLLQGSKIGNASVTEVTWTRLSTPSNNTPTIVGTNGSTTPYSVSSGVLNEVGNYVFEFSFKVGGSAIFNDQVTVTVKPNMSVSSASSSPTLCVNTALTPITHTTTGATGIGTATNLPAGVSASWSGNTITISGTPTASGTFNYNIPLSGGCGVASAKGTITVTANNSVALTSAAGTNNQTQCINTVITPITYATTGATGATLSGLPSGVSGNWASNTVTISGTPTSVGTFNYIVTLTGGCGPVTATGTITVNPTPSATAGAALAAICQGGTSSSMGGSIGGGATGGTWSGGTGTWTNANNPLTATYTAGASESGTVTLTLTTSGGSCGTVTATKTITVNPSPTANAGGALGAICQGGTSSTMGGSVGGGATGGIWSGGTGIWTNAGNPSTATYTAGASESGTVTLTLTTIGGSCGAATATKTITVNQKPTVNAGGALAAICQGGTSSAMGGSIGGGATAGSWYGGTGIWTNANNPSTATYTAGASESGTVTLTLTTSGGSCGALTATKTIMVNALASASVTGNNRICKNTDAVFHLTGTPGATVTYNINGINQTTVVLDISGNATKTVSSAAVNQTLNIVSVSNGTCTNSAATSATVTVGEDSVYTTTWSKGLPNGNGLNAVIAGNYNTSYGDIKACSCTILSGGSLTVGADHFLEVDNAVTNNGTLIVESDGNLIQNVDSPSPANSGNITVKRNIKFRNDSRQEYNYLISPVIGQSLKTIYPGVPTTATYPYVLYYNEANNYFYNSSGAYIAGRGLAVKEPTKADVPADNMDAVFNGVPGNGVISFPLAHTNNVQNGYNLVGNPYPSNIDLQKLYLLNGGATASPKISSTFQFWDNGANNIYTQQGSGYNGRAYAAYNAVNDTGNKAGYLLDSNPANAIGAKEPNKTAKVGQGFMVRATGSGNLVFNNSIRNSNNAGAGFFSKGTQSPADRYWLKLMTPVNAVNTIAVVYFDGGLNAFGIDDSGMNGDSSDMLYSLAEGNKLQIEGKPLFDVSDKIILGSRHFSAGNYTFALDKAEGVFANGQHIYLKDKQTGIITNLSEGSYTFAANAGESTGRFEIIYQSETVLATDGTVKDDLFVYRDGDDFVIDSKGKKIIQVEVYDSSGRLSLKTEPGSLKTVIPAISLSNGVYILKINQAGKITNRKIIR